MRTNFKHLNLIVVTSLGMVVTGTLMTGCAMWERKTSERTVGRIVDDKTIDYRVKHRLAAEPVYKFDDVDVKTFNGVVQLGGFVNSDDQKLRAEEIASQTEGVAQVVNNLVLKPGVTPTGRDNYPAAPR